MNSFVKKVLIDFILIITVFNYIEGILKQPADCGLKPPKGFIVRGKEVDKHEFPFIVLIKFQGSTLCGGAILNEEWIISASHCYKDKMHQKDEFTLHLGAHNLNDGEVYKIDTIINHEKFSYDTMNSDITLLKTATKIKFSKSVATICLPQNKSEPNGKLTVAGWGRLFAKGPPSPTLQKVTLPIISDQQCSDMYAKLKIMVFRTNICTFEPGRDTCEGDSGGPAFQYSGNVATLIGLVSFGWECADPHPGAFTQVSHFIDWIHRNADSAGNPMRRKLEIKGNVTETNGKARKIDAKVKARNIKPFSGKANPKVKARNIKPAKIAAKAKNIKPKAVDAEEEE